MTAENEDELIEKHLSTRQLLRTKMTSAFTELEVLTIMFSLLVFALYTLAGMISDMGTCTSGKTARKHHPRDIHIMIRIYKVFIQVLRSVGCGVTDNLMQDICNSVLPPELLCNRKKAEEVQKWNRKGENT